MSNECGWQWWDELDGPHTCARPIGHDGGLHEPNGPAEEDDQPTHRCRSCDDGCLLAGHCIDIDGEYWHDCHATRQDSQP